MKKLLQSCLVLSLLGSVYAKDTTITLQNGLNGYNGCEDATVYNDFYNDSIGGVNFGESTNLKLLFGKIDSGTTIDKNR